MALRLSELLERIRPAGAPGALTEGERQRDRDHRAREIAPITIVLASFEAEADALVRTALAEADRLRSEGRRRAHEIRAEVPDRIAVAEASAAQTYEEYGRDEMTRLRSQAAQTIAQLHDRSEIEIPGVVAEVIEVIWSQVPPATNSGPGT
jgi:vacuolar-type H+-ATPase subunit H